jgi:predicted porin
VISARDIRGYYGTVGYRFTPKLEGVLRYDYLDANRDLGGDTEVRDIIAGLNYYIKGNNAKIQVNVLRRNGAEGLGNSVSNPSSAFRTTALNSAPTSRSGSKPLR